MPRETFDIIGAFINNNGSNEIRHIQIGVISSCDFDGALGSRLSSDPFWDQAIKNATPAGFNLSMMFMPRRGTQTHNNIMEKVEG